MCIRRGLSAQHVLPPLCSLYIYFCADDPSTSIASAADVFMEDTESEDYFRQIAGCAVGAAGVFDPLVHASLPPDDVTMLSSAHLTRPVR